MNTKKTILTLTALSAAAAATLAQGPVLPPVPSDAGGQNMPNLGMHRLKVDTAGVGFLQSGAIPLPNNHIVAPPQALGTTSVPGQYLPDVGFPAGLYTFADDTEYPQELWFSNSDPSGSIDGTAVDGSGDPIHFNLSWPPEKPESVWIDEALGLDASSPTDDLQSVIDHIIATGSKARVEEGLDILLGTNFSGALTNKVYKGYELLNYRGRKNNKTFDPVTRNITIEQLWWDNEIRTNSNMAMVPAYGDYTITWKLRGLGDVGEDRLRSFPIDEFSCLPMKQTANAYFWNRNAWIWKWFGIVDAADGSGRKFALEDLWAAHSGTDAAPTYADLSPPNPQTWVHADRKFNFGSYHGKNQLDDINDRWETADLDQSGTIGGFDVSGTDTGMPYDASTNQTAQFNKYGNNEVAVPMLDWSQGPYNIPYFGYDSTFTTIRKGMATDVTVRYGQGLNQAGLYNWGWRVHPPRINWIETYADGQFLPSGAPKEWRFGHKWDQVAGLGVNALGDHSPDKAIYNALLAFDASNGDATAVADFEAAVQGADGRTMIDHMRDRRGLPPVDDIPGFPNPAADANLLFSNLDITGDRSTIQSGTKRKWDEGDPIVFTIHNDDNVTRFFRIVDFGTTNYQYDGLDMGIFDWKVMFGIPQIMASAWSGLYGVQGFDASFWAGSDLDGVGNPFYVDGSAPFGTEHASSFPTLALDGADYDLQHHYDDLTGFSGPGYHSVVGGGIEPWGNNQLNAKPTGVKDMWAYAYGKPIPPKSTVTFTVEAARSSAINNGAMYIFDPQFHFTSIWTMHPTSEMDSEGLND
ncbi:MAG: hypothetical protein P1V81_15010 [Planctomycetota bacterium]|nr:hypothetical protein [Planctomycetota bacterium]